MINAIHGLRFLNIWFELFGQCYVTTRRYSVASDEISTKNRHGEFIYLSHLQFSLSFIHMGKEVISIILFQLPVATLPHHQGPSRDLQPTVNGD